MCNSPQMRTSALTIAALSRPKYVAVGTATIGMVTPNQPTCVPPNSRSAHLAPIRPNEYRASRTVVRSAFAEIPQRSATYPPRMMWPTTIAVSISWNPIAALTSAPAHIVPAKKTRPSRTAERLTNPFRSFFGT